LTDGAPRVRLRQAVLVAAELEPVADALREALGLGEPFRDPGVAEFGLHNAVFAIGDCFIEVISPTRPGTAAGRYLERNGGGGGYMAIFDLEDLEGARRRAAEAGLRVVWQMDLPDISGTHLHPADMQGAIVSLDQSRPYGTWRWGGANWTGRVAKGAPGKLVGITLAVRNVETVAKRWAHVLGVPLVYEAEPILILDGGRIRFSSLPEADAERLIEIEIADASAPAEGNGTVEFGVRLTNRASE
jgi:hypothetical protein